jgi:lysozyme
MNLDSLKNMLTRHEGRKKKRYLCSRSHWTIGVGWNIDAWPLPVDIAAYLSVHGEITEGMIDRLLDISITSATNNCRDIYPGFDGFSERRRFALIDFVFNLGAKGATGFKKMRNAIISGDWNEAANQIQDSAYWRQLGGDPKGTDDGKLERPEEVAMMLREG